MRKPELFVNKIDKELRNNDKVYYSSKIVQSEKPAKRKNNNVLSKINAIFISPSYIYKAEVKITLKDKEIVKKIVGRNRSNLITMDNELIPINQIIDIEKK